MDGREVGFSIKKIEMSRGITTQTEIYCDEKKGKEGTKTNKQTTSLPLPLPCIQ